MLILEADFAGQVPVDGYGPGFFRVGGQIHRGNVLVHPQGVIPWGGYTDIDAPRTLADQIDVLFIGTGPEIAFAPKSLIEPLEAIGIMCEAMATPSAARSYNVLLSEGRRVAVALLVMPETA
ncbi:hypothetical protein BFP70_12775 [Thioclava sp. SK-1]|uniref:Mth938-like domain-containing protein n=1 Tax=Thioclava sp. SK-1 TaxID=1889770 RepID=UPI0008253451|nr:Mth938-like domain-containing protein [Thioclava sp. SK-1]OCX63084.1 hypothetical protein BFP70_12775 [Thioclava sp. SK-1]